MLQWLKGLREKKNDPPRQPPSELDHTINVAGLGPSLPEWKFALKHLRRGKPVLEVFWEGCMAHIREEGRSGTIIRTKKKVLYGSDTPCFGIDVKWSDGSESWVPGSSLRAVDSRVEIWS